MNLLENTLSGEWIYALGWTVLHSLWQAALVALIIGFLLLRMQKQASWKRYWVAQLGWISIMICAVVTFFSYYQPHSNETLEAITRLSPEGEAVVISSPSLLAYYLQILGDYFNRHLPMIVTLWAMGMTFFLLRFLGGLIFLQHLRSSKVWPLGTEWESRLSEISSRLGLKKSVQLLESALVKVPMVIGWIKPVILLPVGALHALTSQQVEAILAHELAHIKRHDYLLNLIRSLVEVLFYFNPAVWWLSAQIRAEREHCCDDMALEVCGDSLAYIKALVTLQELNQKPVSGLAMMLVGSKPELLNRVQRILNQPKDKSNVMEKLVITCLLLLALSFTLLSAGIPREKTPGLEPSSAELTFVERTEEASSTFKVLVRDEKDRSEDEVVIELISDLQLVNPAQDTVPTGNTHLQITREGTSYDVRIKNNKIQRLSIDGKAIPEKELINYYDLVQNLLDEVPEPPAPPAPPVPPAPIAVPAPPAPPAPPAGISEPSGEPLPAPMPTPPTPPTPPTHIAPVPPSPPTAPRIKLEKPEKGENDQTFFFREKKSGPQVDIAIANVEWQGRIEGDLNRSVWVSEEENHPISDNVVVYDLHLEKEYRIRDVAPNIVVELEADGQKEPSQGVVNAWTGRRLYKLDDLQTAVFLSDVDQSPGVKIRDNWKNRLESSLFADDLLHRDNNYQIELSDEKLIINSKVQSEETHKKYLQLLEKSLGSSLEKGSHYFFNWNTNTRREE